MSESKQTKVKRTKPKGRKPKRSKEKSPAWWSFTTNSHAFTQAARELSEAIRVAYGEVSIAHYERFLAELPALSDEQKLQVHLDPEVLNLYRLYQTAKEARDSERESFRSFRSVASVSAGLAVASEVLEGKSKTDQDRV